MIFLVASEVLRSAIKNHSLKALVRKQVRKLPYVILYSSFCTVWYVKTVVRPTDAQLYVNTVLLKIFVGVLTTCHTQYTWDRSM